MSTLGEAAKGAADLVAELGAMEQLLEAEQAERRKVTEQAVRLSAENDQLRVDFAKDMAAIASYRNDIADLRQQLEEVHARAQRVELQLAEVKRKVGAGVRILHDGDQQAPVGEKREAVIVAALEVLRG